MFIRSLCAILLVGMPVFADQAGVENALRAEFVDKIVIVRGFYDGSMLRFDKDGKLIGKATPGYWTSEGMVKVSDLSLSSGILLIRAKRILNVFDRSTGKFGNFDAHDSVQLEVQLDGVPLEVGSVRQSMLKVIATDLSELKTMTPDYWECWMNGRARRSGNGEWICSGIKNLIPGKDSAQTGQEVTVAGPNPARDRVFKVGNEVEPPRALSTTDPEYTRAAKAAGLEGVTVLWIVVDERGEVAQISVERPFGAGLDDRAVEAVRTWRFSPARRDKNPVPVIINVEINFRLN
jgi:TonB family protein